MTKQTRIDRKEDRHNKVSCGHCGKDMRSNNLNRHTMAKHPGQESATQQKATGPVASGNDKVGPKKCKTLVLVEPCRCPPDTPYCRMLLKSYHQDRHKWTYQRRLWSKNLGCEFSFQILKHFAVDSKHLQPVFVVKRGKAKQTRALEFRAGQVPEYLVEHIQRCKTLQKNFVLSRAKCARMSSLQTGEQFQEVYQNILRNLWTYKKSGVRSVLRSHLYQLLPGTKEQQLFLPNLKVRLPGEPAEFSFHMTKKVDSVFKLPWAS